MAQSRSVSSQLDITDLGFEPPMREVRPASVAARSSDRVAAKPECRNQKSACSHDEAALRLNFTLSLVQISEIVLEPYAAHAGS